MFRGSLPSNSAMKDQQSDAAYDSSVSVRPVHGAAWRGKFNILSLNLDINITAHVSKNACSKVLEVARMMSASLCLEVIPRIDAWPSSFESSPPTERSIALFFFPEGRDEDVFDNLLNHTICADFALKSMIGEAELLIFTSLQLPNNLHRFKGKPYFWGVFRGQLGAASHQSDYNVHVRVRQSISPNSGNHRSSKRKGTPITIPSKNISSTQSPKADRRGRRLDSAWEHAKPLDVSRQKAECKYCGYVSSHGGISRLKVHLGGGIPGIHLPGCGKVPPEVKKLMVEWFGEWLKNTKALWAKEVKGYVAPEHAKPLNVACLRTDCNFSGESLPEGIPLHKARLGGGDPDVRMEPRPRVLTSEWLKSLTPSTTEKSEAAGVRPETRGRRLDGAWKHVTPMDEVRQKTRCNYCGFVSKYGGISRLKAHLGGGCPQLQLQGCPHVPLDVKSDMEQWFNEWSKNSAASWIPKSHASPGSYKGKRSIDDPMEYAILLDETGEATKCKYCSFVSRYGGIARLKAHLAGGDPIMQLEGCPNVSPEIKILMAQGKKKNRKKSKSAPLDSLGGILQGNGRTLIEAQRFEIRHHVLQETLDEISNTSVKGRLQKLIEEKNAKLRKMQFEVQTLGMQLASIP